jgi:histidyl-tRNA synthetase
MRDLLPPSVRKKRYVIDVIREIMEVYGYEEVETPTVEFFDVLSVKVGDEIRHRMYVFHDRKGRKLALRPEMTCPIARLVSTRLRTMPKPIRLAYVANCFRYDEPQAGRYREFWQAGFELIGSRYPEADAEILSISDDIMRRLAFRSHYFTIGQIGILRGIVSGEKIPRLNQNEILTLIDKGKRDEALILLKRLKVSEKCLKTVEKIFKLKGDPRTILKSGEEVLTKYPKSLETLKNLGDILDIFLPNTETKIRVDLGMARGLEYYTGMIFEVFVPDFKIALNGGGRYDNLIELFGGGDLPAVGCSLGIDRIVLAMKKYDLFQLLPKIGKILIVCLDPSLHVGALSIASKLRRKGFCVEVDTLRRKIKRALSFANRQGYAFTILVGPREFRNNEVIVRDMLRGIQQSISIEKLPHFLHEKIKRL